MPTPKNLGDKIQVSTSSSGATEPMEVATTEDGVPTQAWNRRGQVMDVEPDPKKPDSFRTLDQAPSMADVFKVTEAGASDQNVARALAPEFKRKHGSYNGWEFSLEYPDVFVYYNGKYEVYFTPDWDSPGQVEIYAQAMGGDNEGEVVDSPAPSVHRYQGKLTVDQLFTMVKPTLDALK